MVERKHSRSSGVLSQGLLHKPVGRKHPAGHLTDSHLRSNVPAIVLERMTAQILAVRSFAPESILKSAMKTEAISNAHECGALVHVVEQLEDRLVAEQHTDERSCRAAI